MALNVLCMTGGEIFANVNLKHFALGKGVQHLIYGLLGYAVVIFFLIKSLGETSFLWTSAMWQCLIIVVGSLFAVFLLGEKFESVWQWVGVLLALLSMFFINYKPKFD
jgi:multidrug transporter EmrE-like cation transporter